MSNNVVIDLREQIQQALASANHIEKDLQKIHIYVNWLDQRVMELLAVCGAFQGMITMPSDEHQGPPRTTQTQTSPVRSGRKRLPPIKDRMREIIKDLPQPFSRATLFDAMLQFWPDVAAKQSLIYTTLIDMTSAGELSRMGIGAQALYRVHNLKEPGAMPFGWLKKGRKRERKT